MRMAGSVEHPCPLVGTSNRALGGLQGLCHLYSEHSLDQRPTRRGLEQKGQSIMLNRKAAHTEGCRTMLTRPTMAIKAAGGQVWDLRGSDARNNTEREDGNKNPISFGTEHTATRKA